MQEMPIQSLGGEDPLEEEMQPTPVFLPRKSHGQRSLEGYSLWGQKELDITEWLSTHAHTDLFKKIGDTKGNFHAKLGTIKNKNGKDLIEAEQIKKMWREYTK